MGNFNGAINETNIRTNADVMAVLGESTNNVGALCSSDKINWASKFKPVHIASTPFPDRTSEWWRGSERDCGIKPKFLTSYADVKNAMTSDDKNGWYYKRPYGGAISPYRLADFGKYYHNAVFPIKGWSCSTQVTKGSTIHATLMYSSSDSGNLGSAISIGESLTVDDLLADGVKLTEWKMGLVIFDSSGTRKGRVVGDYFGSCSFNTVALTEGQTYTVYPIFAKYTMGQMDSDITNGYTTIPFCGAKTFKVTTMAEYYGLTITIQGWNNGSQGIRYLVSISISSGSFKVNAIGIRLRFTTSQTNTPMLVGEWSTSKGAYTVTPSNPMVYDETVPAYNLDMSKPYVLEVTLNTQAGIETRRVQLFTLNPDN